MKTKQLLKWTALALPVLLIIAIGVVIGGSYHEHRRLVTEEKEAFPAPGVLVDINQEGDKLHPGEIDAVIGLDAVVPGYVKETEDLPFPLPL
jgi:hypothetical protein